MLEVQDARVTRVRRGVGPEQHRLLRDHELVVELQPVERELELDRSCRALELEVQRLGGEVEQLRIAPGYRPRHIRLQAAPRTAAG